MIAKNKGRRAASFSVVLVLGLACVVVFLGQAGGIEPVAKVVPSEATRGQIWTEMVRAEDRARSEANARFPDPLPHDREAYMRWYNAREGSYEAQVQEYYRPIFKKYRIIPDHLKEISREGQVRRSPFRERTR